MHKQTHCAKCKLNLLTLKYIDGKMKLAVYGFVANDAQLVSFYIIWNNRKLMFCQFVIFVVGVAIK